ncbi:MAG: hypothetical protein AAFQ67_03085, partial [Pseudomonadota bacterium]
MQAAFTRLRETISAKAKAYVAGPKLANRSEYSGLAVRLAPVFLMASLVSSTSVVMSYWRSDAGPVLFWCFCHCLACAVFFLSSLTKRLEASVGGEDLPGRFEFGRTEMSVSVLWGITPLVLVAFQVNDGLITQGAVMAGSFFASAMLIKSQPRLAVVFLAPALIAILGAIVFADDVGFSLMVFVGTAYFSGLIWGVHWSHSRVAGRLVKSEEGGLAGTVLGMLLRDLDESSTDVLWQTDRHGVLTTMPFATSNQKSEQSQFHPGDSLVSLFDGTPGRDVLQERLNIREAFRSVELCAASIEGPVYWELSGKPVY